MTTLNNLVACTPFKKSYNETVMKGKVLLSNQNNTLEELKVLIDAHTINGQFDAILTAGTPVYVKGDHYKQPWATSKYTLPSLTQEIEKDGKKETVLIEFILVPFSEIIMKG